MKSDATKQKRFIENLRKLDWYSKKINVSRRQGIKQASG